VSFSNAEKATVRAPFDESWPLEMLTRVKFEDLAGIGGGTVITLESSARNASTAEQKVFDDGHASMTQGWSGTFAQLDGYIATES
jgi:hypothetical protein